GRREGEGVRGGERARGGCWVVVRGRWSVGARRLAFVAPLLSLFSEGALDVNGALNRIRSPLEGDHEGVALALHLVAIPTANQVGDQIVMVVERRPEDFPPLLPKSGRVLDIREHQGNDARRRSGGHESGVLCSVLGALGGRRRRSTRRIPGRPALPPSPVRRPGRWVLRGRRPYPAALAASRRADE